MADNFLKSEGKDIKNVLSRFKKRNFTGDTGQAIKNSSYQVAQNILMKVGSLIFTIIVARILLPDLFGLYSLALSTIVLFSSFSDLGIGGAMMTFIPKMLSRKNPEKAKGYLKKLMVWKVWLMVFCSLALVGFAYFISNDYYNKPIFYALITGAAYIPLVGLESFFENLFKLNNDFKTPTKKEGIFQAARLILVPLAALLVVTIGTTPDQSTGIVIFSLNLAYLIDVLYMALVSKKRIPFLNSKSRNLNARETKGLKKFLTPLVTMSLSGVFFGYIDTIILGHYVNAEYISYYSAAFNLVGSAAAVIGFAATALFPIFSRVNGKRLEEIFKKSMGFTFLISFVAGLISYFFAELIIEISYGSEYITSTPILRWFSILIIVVPMLGLYTSYFISKKRTGIIAWLLIMTTLLNIILNFFFITYGLQFSQLDAVLGACFATIISRMIYFIGLWIAKKIEPMKKKKGN